MKDIKFAAKHIANKFKFKTLNSEVLKRHNALKEIYNDHPAKAKIVDNAVVIGENLEDPFRSKVYMNKELKTALDIGLHRAVGGDHDRPNPGDILCAALAACMESTIRMIANRIEVNLTHTKVEVNAVVDVRGTLMFDKSIQVGFQKMEMKIELSSGNAGNKILNTLFRASKRSCVVYQTLKPGIHIENNLTIIDSK